LRHAAISPSDCGSHALAAKSKIAWHPARRGGTRRQCRDARRREACT
jgi:hypothetical protein